VNTTRHLDNLGTWVGKGYTQYTSLDQLKTELAKAQASAVEQLFDALAPVSLAEVTAAQTAWQSAASAPTRDARRSAEALVLDQFTETMAGMPESLWAELDGPELRERLTTLLRRGPHGPEFEQARNVVSLFLTNGKEGAGLHAMFDKGIDLELFVRGGYIPDAVSRGSELWS
jgi:hypothetical protein